MPTVTLVVDGERTHTFVCQISTVNGKTQVSVNTIALWVWDMCWRDRARGNVPSLGGPTTARSVQRWLARAIQTPLVVGAAHNLKNADGKVVLGGITAVAWHNAIANRAWTVEGAADF